MPELQTLDADDRRADYVARYPRTSPLVQPDHVYVKADFPGCRAVQVSREELADLEGRIEYWDARTEIAMVAEEVTVYHERPSRRLAQLAEIIGQSRGSPILCVGTADLLLRDEFGAKARIMQADETLYLHPRTDRPTGSSMVVGETLPDVVLEVDHSTDVYRGKIELYESWGFGEVWVEVPEDDNPLRPRRKASGLRIQVRTPSGFEERAESAAFPSWTAEEIHAAINEFELSSETVAAVWRVGRLLGEREGTAPDDSPFLREARQRSREEGRLEGLQEGRLEGLLEGRRAAIRELATRRFGERAAERLEARLAAERRPAALDRACVAVLECATEEAFLAWLAESAQEGGS